MSAKRIGPTRRVFLKVVSAGGACVLAGCDGDGGGGGGADGRVDVLDEDFAIDLDDFPELMTVDSSVLIDAGTLAPISVTRLSNDEFMVTGTECDHNNCTVARNGSGWLCPCHGSRFELDGTRTQGPATGPLTRYQWELDGSLLTVLAP